MGLDGRLTEYGFSGLPIPFGGQTAFYTGIRKWAVSNDGKGVLSRVPEEPCPELRLLHYAIAIE
jgi:hypothetical protein